MKGLLVKDFKLLLKQKNFFLSVAVLELLIASYAGDASLVVGFLPFIFSMFTISTVSYDEYDNGSAFLFTLPVSRAGYVVEKYCFALLLAGGAWLVSLLLACALAGFNSSISLPDVLQNALVSFPVLLLVQALLIPFILKFGGEKGRLVLAVAMGILFAAFAFLAKSAAAGRALSSAADLLSALGKISSALLLYLAVLLVFLLSMRISISIMNRKEF